MSPHHHDHDHDHDHDHSHDPISTGDEPPAAARVRALEVLRPLWALPTTVLPFMPSLRDRLSNRWKDLLWLVAFAALTLERCRRRDVVGPELPVVGK